MILSILGSKITSIAISNFNERITVKSIFLKISILFYLISPGPCMAEEDFSKELIKANPLSSNLFMLEGAGGNIIALLGQEGTLLVDDDFAQMANKLNAQLVELGGASPRFIINSHFHYDHTGGNEVFGKSATIISALAVRDRLQQEQLLWKELHPPVPAQALPLITFEQSIVLHLNKEEIRAVHYPHGHTDGDTVVYFQHAKVVSMGDLYFAGMYPIFHPEHGGSLDGYVKNIGEVLKATTVDTKFVPGHGPLRTKRDLERY